MKFQVVKGETSVILPVFIQDSTATDGSGLAGLIHTSSIVGGYLKRGGTGVALAVDEDVATEGTYQAPSTAAHVRIGTPANMIDGTYELHFHNDLFTTADWVTITLGGAADMADLPIEVQLTDVNLNASNGVLFANVVQVGSNATAATNLQAQYDTTGLTGDTFPATQAQVGNIATGAGGLSALISAFAKVGAEPETNTFEATQEGDGVYHIVGPDTGDTDFYYQATVGAGGKATAFKWNGYVQSNGDSTTVWYWDWVSTTYKQIDTLAGSNGTTPTDEVFDVPVGATGTGADQGKVRLRFLSTTTTAIATDRLLCEFSQASQSVGYANGQIWVDTNSANTNTVSFVDGVADNPVGSWADAITISNQTGLTDFHILNGSTIALTDVSDNFSLFGDNWTLALAGKSIAKMHVKGATVSGTSTGSESDFHDCEMGTCTIAPCSIIASRFASKTGGGFTMQTAGDYTFHECGSKVAGNDAPVFTFPGAGDTFISDRAGSGGRQYEGMSAGDLASIEGWGQFIEGTCSGGAVTIRGCLTKSGITNITLTDNARFDVDQVADAVLDEVNTGAEHNVVNSLGRQIREGTSSVIGAFDVVSATANAVTLDGSASAVAGSYDPSRVFVYEGTGINQSGVVTEYFGSAGGNGNPARTLIFREDFKVTLNNTSKLLILASDGRVSTNQGQLRGGSTTTATLNALSPGADMSGQTLHFTSGTGQDQVALIASYSDPIATFSAIDVAVDNTTGYELLPTGCVNLEHIQHDAQSVTDLVNGVDYIAAQAAQQAVDVLDASVVGSWPFDETPTAGANFSDRSGNANTATLVDANGSATQDEASRLTTLVGAAGNVVLDYWTVPTSVGLQINPTAVFAQVAIAADANVYQAWETLAKYPLTPDKLICVYRTAAGTTHEYDADGKVSMKISTDNGATWGGEIDLDPNEPAIDERNPTVLVTNPTGTTERVHVAWNSFNGANESSSWAVYSDDDGANWSTPVSLSDEITTGRTRGRMIELSTGHLLVPAHILNGSFVRIAVSEDKGVTWDVRGSITCTGLSQETTVVELKSGGTYQGRLGAWIRTSGGYLYSESEDYGVTWTVVTANSLDQTLTVEISTPVGITRLTDDRLLAATTNRAITSDPSDFGGDVTLFVSADEGRTWQRQDPLFYDRTSTGYASLVQLDTGDIGMAWCTNRNTASTLGSSVYFDTIPLPSLRIAETGYMTLECVLARTSATEASDGVWTKGDHNSGDDGGYHANLNASGDLTIGTGDSSIKLDALIADINRHHLAWTVTDRHQRIYLDGELVAAAVYSDWTDDGSDSFALLKWGADAFADGSTRSTFGGQFSRARFLNRALSAEEVKARAKVPTAQDVWEYVDRQLTQPAQIKPPAGVDVADAVLTRDVSNIEDVAGTHSICTIVLATLESSITDGTWTIRKTDGSTFTTKDVTEDENADPITGVT